LKLTLLPEGRRLLGERFVGRGVFQQDNDPTHRVAAVVLEEWSHAHSESCYFLCDWPPTSPALNIIENVWAYVQRKVDARGCRDFDSFKQAVLQEWQAVPKQVLAKLYDSIPKRLAEVKKLGGKRTKY
jgi:hypothetical protein